MTETSRTALVLDMFAQIRLWVSVGDNLFQCVGSSRLAHGMVYGDSGLLGPTSGLGVVSADSSINPIIRYRCWFALMLVLLLLGLQQCACMASGSFGQ